MAPLAPSHALEDLQGTNQALDAQQIVAFFELATEDGTWKIPVFAWKDLEN